MAIESTTQEVLGSAVQWLDDGYKVGLVTVAQTLASSPLSFEMIDVDPRPGKALNVGALGSIKNDQKRCDRLSGLGPTAEAIARLKGPIGLPIGSRTSAEIAISIMAEHIQVRNSIL